DELSQGIVQHALVADWFAHDDQFVIFAPVHEKEPVFFFNLIIVEILIAQKSQVTGLVAAKALNQLLAALGIE
ncbi:hypothetical protein L0P02_11870, partial [Bifidobacterium longum]|nr:hypothetical protein [Bifidobacterium longum]